MLTSVNMGTHIRIDDEVKEKLDDLKVYSAESYNDVILRLLEVKNE